MDFHGNINLKSNEMQNLVFQQESGFPVDAVVGSVVFNDKVLYMAVAIGNDTNPIWIPLTTSIDTYVHDQTAAATTWTVTHSLGSANPIVQIYDANNEMIIPDTITPTNASTLDVSFSIATTGRAVVMHGDEIPANGVGIIEPMNVSAFFAIAEMTYSDSYDTSLSPYSMLNADNISISPDGTNAIVTDSTDNSVRSYTLSVPFDVSSGTETSTNTFTVSSRLAVSSLFVSPDGLFAAAKLNGSQIVRSFSMSVAYDVSTLSTLGSVVPNVNDSRGVDFSADGMIAYVLGASAARIQQYTLSSPYNLSTSVANGTFNLPGLSGQLLRGMQIKSDGTKMLVLNLDTDTIHSYTFGTAFDVTTLSDDGTFLVLSAAPQPISASSMYVSEDGTHMFFADALNDSFIHYTN